MLALVLVIAAQTAVAPNEAPATGAPSAERSTDDRVKTLVMDLAVEGGADATIVPTLSGILSAELAAYAALDVMSNADVKRLLELEGQKESVGCGDASCLAEIAGAMGARLVVFGSLGKLGDKLIVHLNLYDSSKTASVGREFIEAKDVGEMPALLRPKLRSLLSRTYAELGLALPAVEAPPPPPPPAVVERPTPIVPIALLVGGGVLAVGGGVGAFLFSEPLLTYGPAVERFEDAVDVDDAAAARADAKGADQRWNEQGYMQGMVLSSAAAVVGVAALAVGGIMLGAE